MLNLKDIYLVERKVLSVFDFDDTIAKSDAWIYVTRAGRITKKLDPAQFAVYSPRPGEDFDFRDFDRKIRNPRLIKQNAQLLRKQLDKAQKAARGTRKVTILTARRLGQPVTSFLKTMGIDAYVVPLGSADPQKKADWIESQIKKGYDTVYFMDDSNKNIAAVNNMLTRYPNVQSITKLIKEEVTYTNKTFRLSDVRSHKLKALLEGIDKNAIQDIVDKVYPSIANDLGPTRKGMPKVEIHNNVLALHSKIPNHPSDGHEGDHAEYDWGTNTIYLFSIALVNEELVIRALLHEYTHATQDEKKVKAARVGGYKNNKYEKAAARAEENWKEYV
jgi:hypothetical protein